MKKLGFLVITVVVLALVGLGYLGKTKDKNFDTATPSVEQKSIDSDSDAPQPSRLASEIVEDYMLLTLGTLPGASVDYEEAKLLLSEELRTQFIDPRFIPMSYGIQDGPQNVKIIKTYPEEDTQLVDVDAYWGDEIGMTWSFILIIEDGGLKIDGIVINN